jgi:crossover junction endodeoxyribonuclease RusA
MTDVGKAFRAEVWALVKAARFRTFHDTRLAFFLELYPVNRARGDLDNRIKPLLDALQVAGVFDNDEQVDYISALRRFGHPEKGHCRVRVIPLRASDYNDIWVYQDEPTT